MIKSKFSLRFHYYYDDRIDQQAIGYYDPEDVQLSFWDKLKSYAGYTVHVKWQTRSDELANKKFDELGFKGNIGSRQRFTWKDKTYYLLEIQRCRDCWHQWRVVLCDDKMMPIKILPLKTTTGLSRSFANPNIY